MKNTETNQNVKNRKAASAETIQKIARVSKNYPFKTAEIDLPHVCEFLTQQDEPIRLRAKGNFKVCVVKASEISEKLNWFCARGKILAIRDKQLEKDCDKLIDYELEEKTYEQNLQIRLQDETYETYEQLMYDYIPFKIYDDEQNLTKQYRGRGEYKYTGAYVINKIDYLTNEIANEFLNVIEQQQIEFVQDSYGFELEKYTRLPQANDDERYIVIAKDLELEFYVY